MNIYYQDEFATIYNANMETIIKDLKFDYILTDPPYNINYKYPDYHDIISDEEYINLFTNFHMAIFSNEIAIFLIIFC